MTRDGSGRQAGEDDADDVNVDVVVVVEMDGGRLVRSWISGDCLGEDKPQQQRMDVEPLPWRKDGDYQWIEKKGLRGWSSSVGGAE
jgi:hypothetical protein